MSNHIKTDGNTTTEVSVEVLLIQDGDYIVSYCPALELSSFGDTEQEAKEGFEEVLEIFLDDVHTKGTLEKVLLNLGWTLRKKPTAYFQPPVNALNPYSKPIQSRFNERVAIPVF